MDEDYLIVAAHIDETLERRVRAGEYIDFAHLLPRDRVQMEQDHRVELINQNGHLSCAPVVDSQLGSISSVARWEQAFRVFSNIYMRQFPQRASELIQYNHVIHTASVTYAWSNVYAYDIDFRLHMAHHPQRSWSVILQQAWNLRLKDCHRDDNNYSNKKGNGRKEICWRYNRGKCTYGAKCKFDHRCGICGRTGHGASTCRKGGNGGGGDDWDKKDYFRKDKRRDRDHHDDKGHGSWQTCCASSCIMHNYCN